MTTPASRGWTLAALAAALLLPGATRAQGTGADEATALSKKTQNPVSDLISVPFQYNAYLGVDPDEEVLHVLNIQPVVPIGLGERWNLIFRAIAPLISSPTAGGDRANGLGDLNLQPFLSPRKPGKLIWGLGPGLVLPTATDDRLGAEKWSVGPAAVGLTMAGPWVAGALVQNVWSVAGDGDRPDVNQLTIQPFVNHNFPKGWALGSSPIISADWEADPGDRWTVPIGLTLTKTTTLGRQPLSLGVGGFWNAVKPDGAAEWQARAVVSLLFPKGQ